jgi:uncharacterized phage protein (TIGR01671 family)
MNRIIKFRIWNRKTKSWLHGPHERSDLDGVNLFGETILLGCLLDGVSIEDLNELEALQFTGICDAIGKQIFEGDILEFDYGASCGVGKVVYFMQGFYIESRHGALFQDTTLTMQHSKVIGNIFENPELLNKQTKVKIPEPVPDLSDFENCPQCEEQAWDGRICHKCGAKEI